MRDQPAAAGGSARAEYERRRARHRASVRRRRPLSVGVLVGSVVVGVALTSLGANWTLLGWIVVAGAVLSTVSALFVLPDHVRAWDTGAAGEERTGEALAALAGAGFRVLHDRAIPGSRANIDHIVIGPTGVFVIETKSLGGSVRARGGQLWVAGRRTVIIEQAKREAAVVAAVLPGTTVRPLVCIHRADLPWRKLELEGVRVVGPKGLLRALRNEPQTLSLDYVERVTRILEATLPPAA